MKKRREVCKTNVLSIHIECLGILLLTIGLICEYNSKADIYHILITVGSLIFGIGSALVKKFPWAYLKRVK